MRMVVYNHICEFYHFVWQKQASVKGIAIGSTWRNYQKTIVTYCQIEIR